jgi:hypothetical protein
MLGGLAPSAHPGTCPFLYALGSPSPSHFGCGHEVAARKKAGHASLSPSTQQQSSPAAELAVRALLMARNLEDFFVTELSVLEAIGYELSATERNT